jgi:diguanylate cyclase (GGDEF)-like protein
LNFDLRTIVAVMAAMNILFSGMLALVSLHAGNVKGARQWALGTFLIGTSLGLSTQVELPIGVFMAALMPLLFGIGAGLLYNGIQAFKDEVCNYYIPAFVAILMVLNNVFFAALYLKPQYRIIINLMIMSSVHAFCARALFVRVEQPLRTAFIIGGTAFAIVSISSFLRIFDIALSPVETVHRYKAGAASPIMYMFVSVAQMAMSFAFMLMINFRLVQNVNELASTDSLTGALNRRSLEKFASHQTELALLSKKSIAVMMIDIDHFKKINDQYGHPAGDHVLRSASELMKTMVRNTDVVARYGGEEFCMVLPDSSAAEAQILAERLRQKYEALVMHWNGESFNSTISIGIADTHHSGSDFSKLVQHADQALYRAKTMGRNRVEIFSSAD